MGFAKTFFKKKRKGNSSTENSNHVQENPSSCESSTHIEELQQVFRKFDINGDGKISSSELGAIMGSLDQQVTEEELQIMMKEADKDGDGFIDLNEFIELNTKDVDSNEVLHSLREAFSIYDADGNGNITAKELQMVMKSLGENCSIGDCEKMISGVDSDGDGTINFEEFKVMMMMGSCLGAVPK